MHQVPAFAAGDPAAVLRGDALDLGAVRGFAVARVTEDHAVLVQGVQVSVGAPISSTFKVRDEGRGMKQADFRISEVGVRGGS